MIALWVLVIVAFLLGVRACVRPPATAVNQGPQPPPLPPGMRRWRVTLRTHRKLVTVTLVGRSEDDVIRQVIAGYRTTKIQGMEEIP